jgi:hypothetical protein
MKREDSGKSIFSPSNWFQQHKLFKRQSQISEVA